MAGLFDGTPLQRPVTCPRCSKAVALCACPRDAAGQITLPKDQPARVRIERRRGKLVTVIFGLDPRATNLPNLLKDFKTTLGTGGTLADAEVELQGDHRDKVLAVLRERGYPAKAAGG